LPGYQQCPPPWFDLSARQSSAPRQELVAIRYNLPVQDRGHELPLSPSSRYSSSLGLSRHHSDASIPITMPDMQSQHSFKTLDVAIIGGGLGGFAAAISLRRQGHRVTVYEKRDIAAEVGNSISCAKSEDGRLSNLHCSKLMSMLSRALVRRRSMASRMGRRHRFGLPYRPPETRHEGLQDRRRRHEL
jgi:hypothetical protein